MSYSGQTFTNSYNKVGDAQLSVKKYLSVPADQNVYPAVRMVLSRTYTTSGNTVSESETVEVITWTADEVKDAVDAQTASLGNTVTAEHILSLIHI